MIIEGLLWFDDSERTTADKIERAVQRYQQKYGHAPDVCYINPSALPNGRAIERGNGAKDGVRVLPAKSVLPHHFWLGIETKRPKDK